MLLCQFLARKDVEYIVPSSADGSVEGKCPVALEDLVKKIQEQCIKDGGNFTYTTEGETIKFSFWSPCL